MKYDHYLRDLLFDEAAIVAHSAKDRFHRHAHISVLQ